MATTGVHIWIPLRPSVLICPEVALSHGKEFPRAGANCFRPAFFWFFPEAVSRLSFSQDQLLSLPPSFSNVSKSPPLRWDFCDLNFSTQQIPQTLILSREAEYLVYRLEEYNVQFLCTQTETILAKV